MKNYSSRFGETSEGHPHHTTSWAEMSRTQDTRVLDWLCPSSDLWILPLINRPLIEVAGALLLPLLFPQVSRGCLATRTSAKWLSPVGSVVLKGTQSHLCTLSLPINEASPYPYLPSKIFFSDPHLLASQETEEILKDLCDKRTERENCPMPSPSIIPKDNKNSSFGWSYPPCSPLHVENSFLKYPRRAQLGWRS